jgi:predicted phosphodiesterase
MRDSDLELLLIHGHQVDFFNDKLWKVSRFLVRYLWGPLQMLGIMSPGNTALSFCRKKTMDIKLMDWCKLENKGLIAGHTHNFMFPQKGKVPYFNTGCCVYPEGITAIEIDHGNITLVRWFSKIENDTMVFNREVISGPEKLQSYFTID